MLPDEGPVTPIAFPRPWVMSALTHRWPGTLRKLLFACKGGSARPPPSLGLRLESDLVLVGMGNEVLRHPLTPNRERKGGEGVWLNAHTFPKGEGEGEHMGSFKIWRDGKGNCNSLDGGLACLAVWQAAG